MYIDIDIYILRRVYILIIKLYAAHDGRHASTVQCGPCGKNLLYIYIYIIYIFETCVSRNNSSFICIALLRMFNIFMYRNNNKIKNNMRPTMGGMPPQSDADLAVSLFATCTSRNNSLLLCVPLLYIKHMYMSK